MKIFSTNVFVDDFGNLELSMTSELEKFLIKNINFKIDKINGNNENIEFALKGIKLCESIIKSNFESYIGEYDEIPILWEDKEYTEKDINDYENFIKKKEQRMEEKRKDNNFNKKNNKTTKVLEYLLNKSTEKDSFFLRTYTKSIINEVNNDSLTNNGIRGVRLDSFDQDFQNQYSLLDSKIDSDYYKELLITVHTHKALFNSIEYVLDIKINKLSLREQIYIFDNFLKLPEIDKEKVRLFSKKYKENGFKTFLSIEQGGSEMGDKILFLGEKLPKEIAEKLFNKYSEIVDNVNKITDFAKDNFTNEIKTNPELIRKIEKTLYIKAQKLLENIYEEIVNKTQVDFSKINTELERINADTITTFAIFKQAIREGQKLPIESIEGSIFSKKGAEEIEKDKQNEMQELYEYNWKDHTDIKLRKHIIDYFKSAFTSKENQLKNKFYFFEKDNKTRAFVRFEEIGKDKLYASALNVDAASKNFGLGEAMMDEALSREAENNILEANCTLDNISNMRYFEKGFISKEYINIDNTKMYKLVWDEKNNKNILAKQKTKEELIKMYETNNLQGLEIRKSKDLSELNNDFPKDKARVRCFYEKYTNDWYAVYEKVNDNYGVNEEALE